MCALNLGVTPPYPEKHNLGKNVILKNFINSQVLLNSQIAVQAASDCNTFFFKRNFDASVDLGVQGVFL